MGRDTRMVKILERVVTLLEKTESFVVPVRWICKVLGEEFKGMEMTVEELAEKLGRDERFRVFDGSEIVLSDSLKPLVSEDEMEASGFYPGPRVMLKSRIPSREEVVAFLLKKADQTFETLRKAWEIRPQGDEATEDQLLEALAKAQRLQRELKEIFSHETDKSGKAVPNISLEKE